MLQRNVSCRPANFAPAYLLFSLSPRHVTAARALRGMLAAEHGEHGMHGAAATVRLQGVLHGCYMLRHKLVHLTSHLHSYLMFEVRGWVGDA